MYSIPTGVYMLNIVSYSNFIDRPFCDLGVKALCHPMTAAAKVNVGFASCTVAESNSEKERFFAWRGAIGPMDVR